MPDDRVPESSPDASATPIPVPIRAVEPSAIPKISKGPNGIRAGWRLLIYFVIVFALGFAFREIRAYVRPAPPRNQGIGVLEPVRETISRGIAFFIVAIAAVCMARIEREKWSHYGLPLRRAFSFDFWFGCFWGFAGLTVVMLCLWLAGAYRIESLALFGGVAMKYFVLWAAMFLVVGLVEEFLLRGYTQYTLASGVGFWPAAIIWSAVFLLLHVPNPGENWYGLADVFLIGMFFCFTLWRTGDLWFAVGMHAAWDWGQTYFYSVPNSGATAVGHLFNAHTQGPTWLSGGTAGPEGSVFNLIVDLLYFVVFAMIYKRRKWIGMNDRQTASQAQLQAEPGPLIDPSALSQQ